MNRVSSAFDGKLNILVRADDDLRRPAEPNGISSLVRFLCLPAASYINGKEFYIDRQTVCDAVGVWNYINSQQ
ncbi:tropinone reductase 1-like [Prunus yedoensis var. nudiflora]|uniref:Tropinone reductase 1-like n=1 Tax=Prunus yedoensis var. nudiflora TaxID=2094558 RepID=A0A314XT97_PRUYE|nr:tropinone reductase 1-like [Prunus yedoensis var. nudiflora]